MLLLLGKKLKSLEMTDIEKIQKLAIDYYPASTNAVLGTLLSRNQQRILPELRNRLNPTTDKLGLSPQRWPQAKEWFIQ